MGGDSVFHSRISSIYSVGTPYFLVLEDSSILMNRGGFAFTFIPSVSARVQNMLAIKSASATVHGQVSFLVENPIEYEIFPSVILLQGLLIRYVIPVLLPSSLKRESRQSVTIGVDFNGPLRGASSR